jgi:hypothetical protein
MGLSGLALVVVAGVVVLFQFAFGGVGPFPPILGEATRERLLSTMQWIKWVWLASASILAIYVLYAGVVNKTPATKLLLLSIGVMIPAAVLSRVSGTYRKPFHYLSVVSLVGLMAAVIWLRR